ncbi:hypothetical protein [Sphingomonas hengshuiensis]|uniref:hypothetical protein n=1 Tax=Sphingomonas hengshuiensis TaxID=1609977 RepID=UPI000AABE18C|nr:hypothetical protein [Sphingomonas hengshuiensis]
MLISILVDGAEIVIESDVVLKEGENVRLSPDKLVKVSKVEYTIKDGRLGQIAYVDTPYTLSYDSL